MLKRFYKSFGNLNKYAHVFFLHISAIKICIFLRNLQTYKESIAKLVKLKLVSLQGNYTLLKNGLVGYHEEYLSSEEWFIYLFIYSEEWFSVVQLLCFSLWFCEMNYWATTLFMSLRLNLSKLSWRNSKRSGKMALVLTRMLGFHIKKYCVFWHPNLCICVCVFGG